MRLSILIFDGLTTLDAIGGYEVLARLPGMETEFVAARRGIVAADTRQLGLAAFREFSEVTATDILYVPGGPGAFALEKDEIFLETVRRLDKTSTWTVGICNGVGLLAAAGLLKGRKATTNWFYQDRLRAYGTEFVAERYHRDGKYVTGAGVSASIDTGLFLTSLIAESRSQRRCNSASNIIRRRRFRNSGRRTWPSRSRSGYADSNPKAAGSSWRRSHHSRACSNSLDPHMSDAKSAGIAAQAALLIEF